MSQHVLRAAVLVALTVPAVAQDIVTLVVEGSAVAGVGNVTTIDGIAINSAGTSLVEADTDFADTNLDGVLLRDAVLYLREGDALAAPAGASIDSFDSTQLNNAGDSGWNFFLDGTAGTTDDSGFYFNTTLLFQEGAAPAVAGLTPGTPFIGFFESQTDDAGTSALIASVDDPALATTVDRVLVLVSGTDPGSLAIALVAKEGDVLPGQTEAVEDFNTGPHDFAYSESGHLMFFADLTGLTTTDGVLFLDGALLAQEGSPSPIAGRNWLSLSSAKVDVNGSGGYVYSGSLDGDAATNTVIIQDGAKLVQEGDSLPDIAPFLLTSFGSGPIDVDDDGNVLWFGDWDDPDTTRDTGLFRNDQLIVQENVTQVAGMTVSIVRGVQEGYALSDDGRFAIIEVEFVGGLQAALRADFGSGDLTPMVQCTTPLATLTHTGGEAALGEDFTLAMDGGQALGALPVLALATQPAGSWPPCGLDVPGIGEILIDFLPPNPVLVLVAAPFAGLPSDFLLSVPVQESLIGFDVYVQGLYADPAIASVEPFRLTGGLSINIGL